MGTFERGLQEHLFALEETVKEMRQLKKRVKAELSRLESDGRPSPKGRSLARE
jgi:hypothetical protein